MFVIYMPRLDESGRKRTLPYDNQRLPRVKADEVLVGHGAAVSAG
jgi:hypothetical protein